MNLDEYTKKNLIQSSLVMMRVHLRDIQDKTKVDKRLSESERDNRVELMEAKIKFLQGEINRLMGDFDG